MSVGPVTGKRLLYAPFDPERLPLQQDIRRSPLRFTWELSAPAYYDIGPVHPADVPVIILTNEEAPLPEVISAGLQGYRRVTAFRADDGIFHYAPQANIYVRTDARNP